MGVVQQIFGVLYIMTDYSESGRSRERGIKDERRKEVIENGYKKVR